MKRLLSFISAYFLSGKQWSRPRHINTPAQDIHHVSLIIWYGTNNTESNTTGTARTISKTNAKANTFPANKNSRSSSVHTFRITTSKSANPYTSTGAFNNICNQAEDSVEKTLARRQLIVKSNESNSWFIEIKNILRKYNMLETWWYLDNAPKKAIWTTAVKRKIHEYWSKPIVESTPYYNGLR